MKQHLTGDEKGEAQLFLDRLFQAFGHAGLKVERPLAQRFTLQMLIALFAEDIDLLPRFIVAELPEECTTPGGRFIILGAPDCLDTTV